VWLAIYLPRLNTDRLIRSGQAPEGRALAVYTKETGAFLLTFPVFISWKHLCNQLMRYYRIDELHQRQEKEFIVANKRRVVRFMHYWFTIAGEAFLKNKIVWTFIEDIVEALQKDINKYKTFEDELLTLKTITEAKTM